MFVVTHVIEIDQSVHQVILWPLLLENAGSIPQMLSQVFVQVLNQDVLRHRQPLFQQAYVELGYPQGDFNVRLLEVIDHLLDAPEVSEPVGLVKPEAYYQFADVQLEALTAGQKLMIRMGSGNAHRVKVKLAELREALKAAGTSN